MKDSKMISKLILILIVSMMLLTGPLVHAASEKAATTDKQHGTAAQDTPPEINEAQFSRDEIDRIAAALPEGEVRDMVNKKSAANAVAGNPQTKDKGRTGEGAGIIFRDGVKAVSQAKHRLLAFFTSPAAQSNEWKTAFNNINRGEGIGHFLMTVLIAILFVGAGLFTERLIKRATQPMRRQILERTNLGRLRFFGRIISNFLLNVLGFAAFVLTTFVLTALLYEEADPGYGLITAVLLSSYYIKFFILIANFGLSPAVPALRLFPVQDEDAGFLYRWTVRLTVTGIVIAIIAYVFRRSGISEHNFFFLYGLSGLAVNFLLIVMLWLSRKRVARVIWPGGTAADMAHGSMRETFAKSWHFFAIAYVIIIGIYWFVNALTGHGAIIELIITLFLIPLFIGIDQWVQKLLKIASGELPEVIDLSPDAADETAEEAAQKEKAEISHFVPLISTAFRVVLVVAFFFAVLKLWGFNLPIGQLLTRTAFSTVGALLLGYIAWQYIKTVIDRKLKEEMPEEDEDMEEGGAGGSRTVTLLMLLRKFVLAVMIVMISLIMLSSLGINIAPLIAGAGVIGLAIGFGAQTLVKDIISGIFFLIDDAFRVGDYIETAGTKGMVEHISLRSLRLRHPRGPVFTIPFGDMGTVKNNSRDYIIEKLDFRVRYDTNVEKVRKIIKQINKKIQQHEELGPVMLGKLKSQGVRELDDSAMIMRVKFKTIPGEQFVVRREVFQLMQEAFRENGVEFAHKNVTVYLPSQDSEFSGGTKGDKRDDKAPDPNIIKAAGAAAAIASAQEEESKETPPEK